MFLTLKSWFYSCTHRVNIADVHFHSLWQAPTPQRQENPYYCFYWSKISSMTCDWSDAHFSFVRKTIWPIRICAVHYKSIFFSDLAWSKSVYVYYKPTCIHTHFKNFGPCKTLPFSKYTTKGTLMAYGVGYHNHICIKLKTGQFNKQFIHVGNWAKKSSIIQPSALCSFFTWLRPGEKSHWT